MIRYMYIMIIGFIIYIRIYDFSLFGVWGWVGVAVLYYRI